MYEYFCSYAHIYKVLLTCNRKNNTNHDWDEIIITIMIALKNNAYLIDYTYTKICNQFQLNITIISYPAPLG